MRIVEMKKIIFTIMSGVLLMGSAWAQEGARLHPRPIIPTFIISEKMPLKELAGLRVIHNFNIRLVMEGNMLSDSWVEVLNRLGAKKIEMVINKNLNDTHVRQMKRVRKLEVHITAPDGRIPGDVISRLAGMSPVPVNIIVRPGFNQSFLIEAMARLERVTIVLDVPAGEELTARDIKALVDLNCRWQVVIGPGEFENHIAMMKNTKNSTVVMVLSGSSLDYDDAYAINQSRIPVTFRIRDSFGPEGFSSLFDVYVFGLEVVPSSPRSLSKSFLTFLSELVM